MPRVFLGLGSNKGDGRSIIAGAAAALAQRIVGAKLSPLYTSDPLYVADQPAFLNAVLAGDFEGTPRELLVFVNGIEAAFGRDRSKERHKGQRSLDIDILLFGNAIVSEAPELTIPHEGLLERKFALLPLLDLESGALDPRTGKPLAQTYITLGAQGIYYADLPPV